MQNTQAIDTFLEEWRKASYAYYTDLCKEYDDLEAKRWALMEKFSYNCVSPNTVFDPSYVESKQAITDFEENHTKNDMHIIGNMRYENIQPPKGEAFIDKILNREVKSKKVQFIARIEKKSGEINEINLNIGVDGSINGIVVGNKATVDVYSIVAGGYNIQKAHYRVLVKEV